MPLAGAIRSRLWLTLWAMAGIRNEFQQSSGWRAVAEHNAVFLRDSTNYPSRRTIQRVAATCGFRATFATEVFLRHSSGGAGRLSRRFPNPLLAWLYGHIGQRVMVLRPI